MHKVLGETFRVHILSAGQRGCRGRSELETMEVQGAKRRASGQGALPAGMANAVVPTQGATVVPWTEARSPGALEAKAAGSELSSESDTTSSDSSSESSRETKAHKKFNKAKKDKARAQKKKARAKKACREEESCN